MKVIKKGCPIQEQDLVSIGEIIELHGYSAESPVKVVAMARSRNNGMTCKDCYFNNQRCCSVLTKTRKGDVLKVQLCTLPRPDISGFEFCVFKKVEELLEDL